MQTFITTKEFFSGKRQEITGANLRAVKSRAFFKQMKGRGVRIMKADDWQSVTPDAKANDHFVIVDAVVVCEQDKTDSRPMEQKPTVSFEKLMQVTAFGTYRCQEKTANTGRPHEAAQH